MRRSDSGRIRSTFVATTWVVALALGPVVGEQLASAGQGTPNRAGSRSSSQATAPTDEVDDVVTAMAAQKLATDQRLPLEEARRRIEQQPGLTDLAAEYAAKLGPLSGGAYINQLDRGQLVVLTTNLAAAEKVVVDAPTLARSVDFEQVGFSSADLQRISNDLLTDLDKSGIESSTIIRTEFNRVELSVSDTVDSRSAATSAVSAMQEKGLPAVLDSSASVPREVACYPTWMNCDAPMRGGLGIAADNLGITHLCTTGFNVVSASDLKSYVLTAGHCISETNFHTWREHMPMDRSDHVVGDGWEFTLNHTDSGIISVNNVPGWNPGNDVLVHASFGTPPTSRNENYAIDAVGSSASIPGGYLCGSGIITQTRCGAFLASGQTYPGTTVNNLGVVDFGSCQGDSGGPVYIGHSGYGIVIRGGMPMGTLNISTAYGTTQTDCFAHTWYVGLNQALSNNGVILRTS